MLLHHAAASDPGRQRRVNEDAYGDTMGAGGIRLFCVADGMGGFQAGDVASRVGVEAALAAWQASHPGQSVSWRLTDCVNQANHAVLAEAGRLGLMGQMGSTIVVLAVEEGAAHLAHAGDSRAYRLRAGRLERMTADHTEAAEMAAAGQIDPSEVDDSEYAHVVTRGLGLQETLVPDLAGPLRLVSDDTFLLCTDGLTDVLSDGDIRDILRFFGLAQACDLLVRVANSRGGPDNVTVQLVRPSEATEAGPLEAAPTDYRLPFGAARRWPALLLLAVVVVALVVALVLILG
jgi:protein phosphatase